MPKKRHSTRTSRQKAASRRNLANARKHAGNARVANQHGALKQATHSLKKSAMFRAAAAGKQRGKTIEPKAHSRKKGRAA